MVELELGKKKFGLRLSLFCGLKGKKNQSNITILRRKISLVFNDITFHPSLKT